MGRAQRYQAEVPAPLGLQIVFAELRNNDDSRETTDAVFGRPAAWWGTAPASARGSMESVTDARRYTRIGRLPGSRAPGAVGGDQGCAKKAAGHRT